MSEFRDYRHAAKAYVDNIKKSPYTGFSFHVNIAFADLGLTGNKDISIMVKSTDLPEIRFETETLNQYNRKRIVKKKVEYQPIKLTFHDDVANTVRNMWVRYNAHYNADSQHTINEWNQSIDDTYQSLYDFRVSSDLYGLNVGNSSPFIRNIEIISMGVKEYSKMTLINPVIVSAAFDNHDYSESSKVMSLDLTIEYEGIVYDNNNSISESPINNFGIDNDANYDQNPSPLNAEVFNFGFPRYYDEKSKSQIEDFIGPEGYPLVYDETPGKVSNQSTIKKGMPIDTKQYMFDSLDTANDTAPVFPNDLSDLKRILNNAESSTAESSTTPPLTLSKSFGNTSSNGQAVTATNFPKAETINSNKNYEQYSEARDVDPLQYPIIPSTELRAKQKPYIDGQIIRPEDLPL